MNILKITDEVLFENQLLLSRKDFLFWFVEDANYDLVEVDNPALALEYKGKYYLKQRLFHGDKAIIAMGSIRVYDANITQFKIFNNVYNYM